MFSIFIEQSPSFNGGLELSGINYQCQFDYNQIADRWSFSMWEVGEDGQVIDCPLIAGDFITGGKNLIEDLRLGHRIMVVDKQGIDSTLNWFDRLTKTLSDGLASTFIVVGTDAEFTELQTDVSLIQPFC